jgi:30S ribosome assembly GTPase
MSKITKCLGCGALLQNSDQNLAGYTYKLENPYCMSCYKLMHYGSVAEHFHPKDLPILEDHSLVFMMSSVLHLDLLFHYPVYRFYPNLKFVYIINQIDLLPAQTNLDLLIEKITSKAKSLNIPYMDLILMSAKNPKDLEAVKKYLVNQSAKRIYLLGVQNSGKTTLFKALTDQKNALALKKAGLTQEALEGTFSNKTIIDMPGLYQKGYLHTFLSYEQYKRYIPDKEIKPRIYRLKKNQSLVIQGFIAVTNDDDKIVSYVLYVDSNLNVIKTNDSKIDHHLAEVNILDQKAFESRTFKIDQGKSQITFADMGMLHLSGPTRIKIKYPKVMHISVTEALFK